MTAAKIAVAILLLWAVVISLDRLLLVRDLYAWWVPLSLILSLVGFGFMLGRIWR